MKSSDDQNLIVAKLRAKILRGEMPTKEELADLDEKYIDILTVRHSPALSDEDRLIERFARTLVLLGDE